MAELRELLPAPARARRRLRPDRGLSSADRRSWRAVDPNASSLRRTLRKSSRNSQAGAPHRTSARPRCALRAVAGRRRRAMALRLAEHAEGAVVPGPIVAGRPLVPTPLVLESIVPG